MLRPILVVDTGPIKATVRLPETEDVAITSTTKNTSELISNINGDYRKTPKRIFGLKIGVTSVTSAVTKIHNNY